MSPVKKSKKQKKRPAAPKAGKVLLYAPTQELALRLPEVLSRAGIALQLVSPEEYALPLGALLQHTECESIPSDAFSMTEPMVILHGFDSPGLDRVLALLRESGLSVSLKAVTTPTNLRWSGQQIYRELLRERLSVQMSLRKG